MKGSLITIGCFIAGCIAGITFGAEGGLVNKISLWLLYLLMLQAGMSIGSNPQLPEMMKNLSPRILLLPVAIVIGAIVFSAIAGLLFAPLFGRGLTQYMSIGSACGYYSLASLLIGNLMEPTLGVTVAAEIATVALLANIFRELFALVAAPWIVRWLSPEAEIAAAGVTAVDVCLPAIKKWCGLDYLPAAIVCGVLIDIATPFIITFFCSLN
ncbi:MAG: lysine exporter LysO family protein [Paramuribaculum sp.]|nr:lysine exporter LysO family protein [Paramuribaculum sp.]